MRTNLKKVFSAVIALALATSLVPASFAAKVELTDIADTATYATAVKTLVALDVINGYGDGTFLPDNLITRAEATKVMVAALNGLEDAEGMKGSTQFTDVTANHEWASGYINAGVQKGYINGMGDNKFAPDANVTYAQMVKMLVSAMNYEDYATWLGGYPNGYLQIARQEGITAGVSANNNDYVTRAQVAQLVYNALNTPIVINGSLQWQNGQLVPSIEKMDGRYNGYGYELYKSILTEYFNAYMVEGVATRGDKGEITFNVQKTKNYDAEISQLKNTSDKLLPTAQTVTEVKIGDVVMDDYYGVYSTAIIAVNDLGEKNLISFVPSGKNKTVAYDVELIDAYDSSNFELDVYLNENANKPTAFDLNTNAAGNALDIDVFVNGFKVTDADDVALTKYVVGGTIASGPDAGTYTKAQVGQIELVDTYPADGDYDVINVVKYTTTNVTSINTKKSTINVVNKNSMGSSIVLDLEADEDIEYKITLNGEAIELAELKKDDVLSVAVKPNGTFSSSKWFDIIVSRDTVSGKAYNVNDTDDEVTLDGEIYTFVDANDFDLDGDGSPATGKEEIMKGREYTFTLDAFGRVYKSKTDATKTLYGIVTYVDDSDPSDNRVRIYTSEGASKTYTEVDATVTAAAKAAAYTSTTLNNLEDRVVKYTLNSKGEIKTLVAVGKILVSNKEYEDGYLGAVEFADVTKIIDATEWYEEIAALRTPDISNLKTATADGFLSKVAYDVYTYDTIDDAAAFVLIKTGVASFNAESKIAVVNGAIYDDEDENGDYIQVIPVVAAEGEEDKLIAHEDCVVTGIDKYDVIVYKTNGAGQISEIKELYNLSAVAKFGKDSATDTTVDSVVEHFLANTAYGTINAGSLSSPWVTDWAPLTTIDEPIQLLFGAVIDVKDSSFSLAYSKSNYTVLGVEPTYGQTANYGESLRIRTNADTKFYSYEVSLNKNKASAMDAGQLISSDYERSTANIDHRGTGAEAYSVIDWSSADNQTNMVFAFAVVVDGVATNVVMITE